MTAADEKVIQLDDPFFRQISGTTLTSEVPSTVADSTVQYAEASQTLIFLDWDDTLFPTTELFDRWNLSCQSDTWDAVTFSEEHERQLDRWREALLTYVRNACTVSQRVVIVTNAQPGWVEDCIKKFAPNLMPFFYQDNGPHVVYAIEALRMADKRNHQRGVPASYAAELSMEEFQDRLARSKFAAMQEEAKGFYSQYPNQTWKNIISVGDATFEYVAVQEVAFRRKGPIREALRTKRIVTPHAPSIQDMTHCLSVASLLWPIFVVYDGDIDVNMTDIDDFSRSAIAMGMPELRSFMCEFPIREDQEVLANSLDELAVLVQQRIMWCSGT